MVLVSRMDGAGWGESVNRLNEWFDPRFVRTFALGERSDEEQQRPGFWRYWRALPAAGRIGLYVGSWCSEPLAKRGQLADADWQAWLEEIRQFERLRVDDGTWLIKVWLHLSRDDQRRRLTKRVADPSTAWRVTARDWEYLGLYDRFRALAAETRAASSTPASNWALLNGANPRFRAVELGNCEETDCVQAVQADRRGLPQPQSLGTG